MRRRIMAVLTVGLLVLSMTGCKSSVQPIEADGISFICDGKAVVNIQKYEIVVD